MMQENKAGKRAGDLGMGKGSFKTGGQGKPLCKVMPEQRPVEGQESWTICGVFSTAGPAGAEFLRVQSRQEASVVGAG